MEWRDRQNHLVLMEVDHRIKNSLQIVSGLLHMQAATAGEAAPRFHNAALRINAIAAVHRQLYKSEYIGAVELGQHLRELCQQIVASASSEQVWSVEVDCPYLMIGSDIAVPLSLIVNELLTNSIQHSRPAAEGALHVAVQRDERSFSVRVSDPGNGPDPAGATRGLGSQLVESLGVQIRAILTREILRGRYVVTISVPYREPNLDPARLVHAGRPAPEGAKSVADI